MRELHRGHRDDRDRARDATARRSGSATTTCSPRTTRRAIPACSRRSSRRSTACKFNESAARRARRAMLITYNDKATVKVPMGPLRNITGGALGTQKDYHDTKGTEHGEGHRARARRAPTASSTARKALIVDRATARTPTPRPRRRSSPSSRSRRRRTTSRRSRSSTRACSRRGAGQRHPDDDPADDDGELERREHRDRAQRDPRAHGRPLVPDVPGLRSEARRRACRGTARTTTSSSRSTRTTSSPVR